MNEHEKTTDQADISVWSRLLYMILFAIAFSISETVMLLVAVVNLVFKIVKNEPNSKLLRFGGSLAQYLHQIANFLTFNTEYRPFPFNDWPTVATDANVHA